MRARIHFKLNGSDYSLAGKLIEGEWWVKLQTDEQLPQNERDEVKRIISEIENFIAPSDVRKFKGSRKKYAVKHFDSDSEGVISDEGKWILRLHNANVSPLQDACSIFVSLVRVPHTEKQKLVDIYLPIEIVEDKKTLQLIDGYPLIDKEDRKSYIKKYRHVEKWVMISGVVILIFLFTITYPWDWRTNCPAGTKNSVEAWGFSILEKMVGSVTVATLLAAFHYWSFRWSLRAHTIKWEIHEE